MTAGLTGAGRTGLGCDVINGTLPIGTDFQVAGMTAANVDHGTDEPVTIYSNQTDNLATVVPAGADTNPVGVNFAATRTTARPRRRTTGA